MTWDVAGSDEFVAWYDGLDDGESDSLDVAVGLLEQYGSLLGRPHADVIRQSHYPNMKSCAYNTRADRTASCSLLTRVVVPT